MKWKERASWRAVGRGAVVTLLVAAVVLNAATISGGRYLAALSATALVCGVALLAPRRWWPVAPFLITAATVWWGWPLLLLLSVALFDLSANRKARWAIGCAGVALGANPLGLPATSLWGGDRYGATVLTPALAVAIGLWLGNRRRLVAALASQVQHLRIESELREEAARNAERSRIASEMHDVLAHRLSLIALHSGVLVSRSDTLPGPVAERLALLRTASTEALTDLRDLLGALREDTVRTGLTLTPVLRDVEGLVDEARASGQHVELTVLGDPAQVPTAHQLAVFRIVQEALTNARKHAAGGEVTAHVDYQPPTTFVEIVNSPGTTAGTGTVESGYGLVGLRERVATLAGHLNTGPAGGGAWRVAALIPQPTPHGTAQDGDHS